MGMRKSSFACALAAITGRNRVDYFLLTHFHSDHGGRGFRREQGWGTGIIKLLSDFSVDFAVGAFIHVGEDGAPRSSSRGMACRTP